MLGSKESLLPGLGALLVSAFFLAGTAVPALASGGSFTNSILHGTYSVRALGYDDSSSNPSDTGGVAPGIPLSTSGILVFDGQGNITAADLFNIYGIQTPHGVSCVSELGLSSTASTYTVNADGTVVIVLNTEITNDSPAGVTDPCAQGTGAGTASSATLAGGVSQNGKEINFTGLFPTAVVIDGVITRTHGAEGD